MLCRIDNVCKDYGKEKDMNLVRVLNNVSTQISKGDICVILGPSGSGKSTLLNIVGGLDTVTEGKIFIDDMEITGLNSKKLSDYRRDKLGFVFQFYNLIPNLTVYENVETCRYLSANPLDIDELLEELGLKEHKNKYPSQLSGGQQQRCSIARALVKNPEILLCDEPTGALDYKTSKEILILLEKINKKYGTTMLVVTHNEEIRKMANKIIKIKDGRIIEDIDNNPIPAADIEW